MSFFKEASDYGGQTVRESKKGWLIDGWSKYQGNRTRYKFLIPYDNCKIKKGENLSDLYFKKGEIPGDPYHELTKGEYLIQNYFIGMYNESKIIKILNRGYLVQ